MGSGLCKPSSPPPIDPTADDEPTTIPVVDKKASDLRKFGGELVKTNGPKDLSGVFSMRRAKDLCELCKLVYFFGGDWASKKPPPSNKTKSECIAPAQLSMPLRFTLGDLTRTRGTPNHELHLTTLDGKYDQGEENKGPTWRNGFVVAPGTNTEGMLLADQDGKYAVIVMRGTSSPTDVLTDLKAWKTSDPTGGKGRCHSGIANAYKSIAESLYPVVSALFKDNPRMKVLFVTGHSLGGGLATLAAKGIKMRCPEVPKVTMYSYGGAIVGNTTFKKEYDKLVPNTFRLVCTTFQYIMCTRNRGGVTCMPPSVFTCLCR